MSAGLAWLLVVYPFATLPLILGLVLERRKAGSGPGAADEARDPGYDEDEDEDEDDAEGFLPDRESHRSAAARLPHRERPSRATPPVRLRTRDEPMTRGPSARDPDLDAGAVEDLLGEDFDRVDPPGLQFPPVPLGLPARSDLGAAAVRVLRSRTADPWLRDAAARLLVKVAADLPDETPARTASGRGRPHRR